MPEMESYFIDCHCHMFTIADVPLYKSIFTLVSDADKLHKKLIYPFAGPFLPAVDLKKLTDKYQKYIRYFEFEPGQNVAQLTSEVDALFAPSAGKHIPAGIGKVILTPLVMDFDLNGGTDKLRGQLKRLREAVKANTSTRGVILPFLGVDPRRPAPLGILDDEEFKEMFASLNDWKNPSMLASGSFIGIKLYPPLGFNVDSSECRALCKTLAKKQIPVTVHCQHDSFRLVDKADPYTHPKNWEELFKVPEIQNLRINFAHFGGEYEVAETAWFEPKPGDGGSYLYENYFKMLVNDRWTGSIIRLLKNYPNTYSDVAAFDSTDRKAIAALKWILHKDEEGYFPGPYKLADKLLWGSDYPMTLEGEKSSYSTIFNGFFDALKDMGNREYELPAKFKADLELLSRKMMSTNPMKFLRLT